MQSAVKIIVTGIVQGVGFRPFIYRLAAQFHLSGSVQNTPLGAEIILFSSPEIARDFIDVMCGQLPPLAKIKSLAWVEVKCLSSDQTFKILPSVPGESATEIPADTAICVACIAEIFSPDSRYYLYPFTSCTSCGPRFSVITSLPYDRDATTFVDFPLCDACLAVYQNPLNRRYHAQTTVCEKCGPVFSNTFKAMLQVLQNGKVLALKSHNGFRLIVNAKNKAAVGLLRERKKRPYKPFALMALNSASIKQYVELNAKEEALLNTNARPIVLLNKKQNHLLPDAVAPGLNELGLMLPATGLDYLLFYYLLNEPKGLDWLEAPNDWLLVVTSANFSGGSIIADNEQAREKLHNIADLIVTDNRKIAMQSDDSVMRVVAGKEMMIRRSRGFAPLSIELPEPLPNVLATGALLKNTFCFIGNKKAYLSQYIGDMDSAESIAYFNKAFVHYQRLFGVSFDALACDFHPDLYTTHFAEDFQLPLYQIQHHEAHAGAVIAEHNLKGEALALILDGFGLGEDGVARGGELYYCDMDRLDFVRCGELVPMWYLGGDRVQKEPWRMALALCVQLKLPVPLYLLKDKHAKDLLTLLRKNQAEIPVTTSMGRLFDAVSSLINVCHYNSYEAEAAMKFEALAKDPQCDESLFDINNGQLDLSALIACIIAMPANRASDLFHGTLAYALAFWVNHVAKEKDVKKIILSGGCFQNKILLTWILKYLAAFGLESFIPEQIPANDGGISFGQAWIAARKLELHTFAVLPRLADLTTPEWSGRLGTPSQVKGNV
ncbi:carbamoyltransferase HypF [Caedibacter taeniospiralis]|uniref:carbamoyltransferase HypF n=1 Tax=Caedibacter taeniospiralis TaxID=28907 RepID=UPI001E3F7E71|nr:carbamoyltransferase HypF [Caedibacter taeniospiralis]